jgi:hypothetical protein
MLTADKLKDTLSQGALHYVLGLEGDECYTLRKVANAGDVHCSIYNADGTYKAHSVTSLSFQGTSSTASKFDAYKNKSGVTQRAFEKTAVVSVDIKDAGFKGKIVREVYNKDAKLSFNKNGKSFVKRACYVCGSEQHLASTCPKKAGVNSCVSRPITEVK